MKFLKLGVLGLILVIMLFSSFFIFGSYSSGYRAGRIMKLSHKGFVFKTYEGQLDIGGLQGGGDDGAASTVWDFSVKDDEVVTAINEAVDYGWDVKLHYREKYYKLFFFGDTKYFVYEVEKIKESKDYQKVEE